MFAVFAGLVANMVGLGVVTVVPNTTFSGVVEAVARIVFVSLVSNAFVAVSVDPAYIVLVVNAASLGCVADVAAFFAAATLGCVVVVGAVAVVDVAAEGIVAVFVVIVVDTTDVAFVAGLQRLFSVLVLLSFSMLHFYNISGVRLVSCLLYEMLL